MSDISDLSKTGPAAGFVVLRLKKRAEFLNAAKGIRVHRPNLTLQRQARRDESQAVRCGFTVTKKEGNAVARNRIRRRLKAAAAAVLPGLAAAGCDYVIIGRQAALASPFPSLLRDLKEALAEAARRAERGLRRAAPPSTDPSPPSHA